ncbi:MAG: hypothetical protein Ta2F_02400 [Termitinemataceae bacterium]|nr:MAG: hypothetical protein Ta2F_02400 [Termitinemataceae bacterium]
MKNILFLFFALAFLGSNVQDVESQENYNFPRLESDPQINKLKYSYDENGNKLQKSDYSWQDLFAISLWASGAQTTEPYIEKINSVAAELSKEMPKDQKERAEYILNFLHKNIFKGYSANQTKIDVLLTNGRFNCVSSAVVYSVLAKYSGLEVKGVITKDHAFVCVIIDGETIDIETTNPYGFDPGKRKEFQDNFGKATGFAYTPPGNYRNRQTISLFELDSVILRNRIADFEKVNKFAEAVPLAIDRAELLKDRKDPTESALFVDPYTELDDALFNVAAFYLNKNQEVAGLAWADTAEIFFKNKNRLHEFISGAVNNSLGKELRTKKFDAAIAIYDKNAHRFNETENNTFKGMILDAQMTELVNVSKTDETTSAAIKQLEDAEKTGLIEKKRLDQLKQTVGKNRIAYFHNTFAKSFNQKDFTAAETVLNKALKEFPDNKQFISDQKTLQTAKDASAKKQA